MGYRKTIEIFKIKDNISLPLAENPAICANSNIGDYVVCWDGENVWARDWTDNETDQFVLLQNNLEFIKLNPSIFYLLT